MLAELVIENYAVIERLRVRFHRGLNLLTGETGSGKSIVVDAFGLLLGGRASPEMIRTGADRARVSGIFEAPPAAVRALLQEAGIEPEEEELLIEREILAGGKSRAWVSNRPVTAALLRQIGQHLGDIHGQHEQQRLYDPAAQLEMLDAFAGAGPLLEEVREWHRRWRACRQELEELERNEQEKERLADLWSFQCKEIEQAAPKAGEDAELEAERRRLQNFARIEEAARGAYEALYEAEDSALARIRASLRRLEDAGRIDPQLAGLAEGLRGSELGVEEAALGLRDYLSRLEFSPERLEEIETRLAALDKLKRKYGPGLEQVLAYLEEVRGKLAAVENAADRRAALERQLKELSQSYERAAGRLSALRKEAARRLSRKVEEELAALAMERTRFRIQFAEAPWSAEGFDAVQFLVSPNPGEEPRPLEKVASGGEVSRIALALKSCAAVQAPASGAAPGRTLVFDEVDAGIGGRAAEAVGRRLKLLSKSHQVLCVTHLPQIAGFADHHFFVEKAEVKGRTAAALRELVGEARTREIGRMLSGEKLTPEALRHAEKLIEMCGRA
ncbi:MAG: DNA repair protein RecN [Bryobacteraceae bacterium]|nr:DNA repair protein RecN [Bryobacteraceae bacterium]